MNKLHFNAYYNEFHFLVSPIFDHYLSEFGIYNVHSYTDHEELKIPFTYQRGGNSNVCCCGVNRTCVISMGFVTVN